MKKISIDSSIPSWEDTFLELSSCIAKRSKDPKTKVGACIVSKDNRILSLGYNGSTFGMNDKEIPWGERNREADNKYLYVVHAERNAILNYRGNLKDFESSSIYITHQPCLECSKEIVQVGIKTIFYGEEYTLSELEENAKKRILQEAGIKEIKLSRMN